MSDTFDHEGDAWDSYEQGLEDQEPDYRFTGQGRSDFIRDPLYYHQKLKFVRMTNTTDKAVQLETKKGLLVWLPRSVCLEWREGSVMVHRATLKRSLKQAKAPVDLSDLLPD